MNNEQLTAYLQDESYLYTLSYEELKTLVVQYPYAANLRILLLKKAHLDQNKDYDRNLQMAAAYATNRRFLYKLVKKLKSLQAVPVNVILAEDYLELTELSNIEKILSTRQPAEAYAANENTRTLSADFNLNFEPPTHSPEDDEALFNLTSTSADKPDFDFMTDEEVDFLVDDIVAKFKVPEEAVLAIEQIEAQPDIIDKKDTISEDFQAVFNSNGVSHPENTGLPTDNWEADKISIDNEIDTHDSDFNTHFFEDNDDPEWALNAKEDSLIEEEISKLEIFSQPINGVAEKNETVSNVEPIEDFQPIEKTEIASHVEPIEDFHPIEKNEIASHVEYIEDIQPIELTEIMSQAENIEDFKPTELPITEYVVNENVSTEMQDLYYTSFLPLLTEEDEIQEAAPLALNFIEDAIETTPAKNETEIPNFSFIETLAVKEPVSTETPLNSVIEDFIDNKKNEIVVPPETPKYSILDDFKEIRSNDAVVSGKKPKYSTLEDFMDAQKNAAAISAKTPMHSALEGFKDVHKIDPMVSNNTPLYSTIEDLTKNQASDSIEIPLNDTLVDLTETRTQDDTVFMQHVVDNPDLIVKKKDNTKPIIELEIINQSKATLVESTTPPSVSDPSTSFSEWLQQFQKPKPVEISHTIPVKEDVKAYFIEEKEAVQELIKEPITRQETVKDILQEIIKEPLPDLENLYSNSKNKQRKYTLDNLTGIFEKNNGLPDNLFFGLSATDTAPNIVEKQHEAVNPISDNNAILNDFLNESATISDEKDMEWLNIPLEKHSDIEESETPEYEGELAQEEAPQKKKKKKIMHELAAKSLIEDDELISEPLADIFAAQGLNDKAIEMYQRLSLHIPEKSDFFAAKIEKLRTTS